MAGGHKEDSPGGGAGADCINIVQLMASLIESCIHHHQLHPPSSSPTLGNISLALTSHRHYHHLHLHKWLRATPGISHNNNFSPLMEMEMQSLL